MKSFLLAAGLGTRMQSLTRDTPKPLLKINGYPMIYYQLFFLWLCKVELVIINIHHHADQIREYLINFPYFPIHYSKENELLGTAGGVYHTKDRYLNEDETFLLLNSDTIRMPDHHSFFQEIQMTHRQLIEKEHRNSSLLYLQPLISHMQEKSFYFPKPNPNKADDISSVMHMKQAHNPKKKAPFQKIQMNQNNLQHQELYYYIGLSFVSMSSLCSYRKQQPSTNDFDSFEFSKVWASDKNLYAKHFPGEVLDIGNFDQYKKVYTQQAIPSLYQEKWKTFLKGWNVT